MYDTVFRSSQVADSFAKLLKGQVTFDYWDNKNTDSLKNIL
jgi:hypothetical protein